MIPFNEFLKTLHANKALFINECYCPMLLMSVLPEFHLWDQILQYKECNAYIQILTGDSIRVSWADRPSSGSQSYTLSCIYRLNPDFFKQYPLKPEAMLETVTLTLTQEELAILRHVTGNIAGNGMFRNATSKLWYMFNKNMNPASQKLANYFSSIKINCQDIGDWSW